MKGCIPFGWGGDGTLASAPARPEIKTEIFLISLGLLQFSKFHLVSFDFLSSLKEQSLYLVNGVEKRKV